MYGLLSHHLSNAPVSETLRPYRLFGISTDPVLEEYTHEIFCQSRDSHNVPFMFHVSLGYNTFVERFGLISDRPKITERGLALLLGTRTTLPTARAGALARGHP